MISYVLLVVGAPLPRDDSAASLAVHKEGATLLREHPMLGSHDAATGYVGSSDVRSRWIQCQCGSFPTQASCGTRAFDLRLGIPDSNKNSVVKFHHGGMYMNDQTVGGTMNATIAWANGE